MEIQYGTTDDDHGYCQIKVYPVKTWIRFTERQDNNNIFFNTTGMISLVGEGLEIPKDYIFDFGFSKTDFEDAILELAEKIKKERLTPEYEKYPDIVYDPQPSTEDKLIDIIQKLVKK